MLHWDSHGLYVCVPVVAGLEIYHRSCVDEGCFRSTELFREKLRYFLPFTESRGLYSGRAVRRMDRQ